ncbi:hypothetical protein JGU71_10845 [Antrihabitans sp. YC3-6]|jgi:hypothetical protein|uniref:Ig-like domain-containing protein n=1 Tax=Antrihabitans stalagmiti TaxID=2799499 RepID=A0A934NQ64_9NOCA|nr:hypothetical protein [Antrihabitans stalagmiti]MBJ8339388.1 hypothetical protein [Antrihabitans stalagmiti]
MNRKRQGSRLAAATAVLGTAALTMVLSAPTASAGVTSINIEPGLSTGSSNVYGAGCTYKLTATTDNGDQVFFQSTGLASFGAINAFPVNNRVETTWTPRQNGRFWVTASIGDGSSFSNVEVTIGRGIPIGPFCIVIP